MKTDESDNADAEAAVGLVDDRGASRGWGRIVPALFWIAGVSCAVVAVWGLVRSQQPLGPSLITLMASVLYLGAALGLTHNGRRMRLIAWTCLAVALAGPLIQGLLQLGAAPATNGVSPWQDFGLHTGFASVWLPLLGIFWLWWSNPRRIVELNG